MRAKLFLLFCFQLLVVLVWAQDSLSVPVMKDSVTVTPHSEPEAFMEDGYYDDVPRINDIPTVDTAIYKQMVKKYDSEEFSYDENSIQEISLFQKIMQRLRRWFMDLFPTNNYFNFSDVVYKVLAVVAIVVLLWIAYKVLFSGKRFLAPNKKEEDNDDEIRYVEKNLLDIDLRSYIEKAKQEEDYARAIRYLSLLNIQLLAKKELFQWKYTKTSVELIEELEQMELKKDFARNIEIFNRVWYGNIPLDKAKYDEYASYFLTFQTKWQ